MILLHSVTKLRGRGEKEKVVIDGIDWVVEPHTSYVILGHRAAGKSTLLQLISGSMTPTTGWVERRGIVSPMSPFLRLAGQFSTPQHMAEHMALLYRTDGKDLCDFVARFADIRNAMDIPIRRLPPLAHQKLGLAFFYGLPCDLYLFDRTFETRVQGMREKCRQAVEQRRKQCSMILATSSTRAAREFGGVPGILFRGKLRFFDSLDSAIEIFARLPVDPADAESPTTRPSDPADLEEAV